MGRALRYADAVALLGGDSPAVAALDRVLGGALLAATGGGVEVVANMLGARTEAVRVGHELVGNLRDRIRGYSRFDRTQRLIAAHTVVVITSFFEALNETPLPIDLRSIELTAEDQLRLAGQRNRDQPTVQYLLDISVPIPGPGMPFEAVLERLRVVYRRLATDWRRFVSGLVVWDELDEAGRGQVVNALRRTVPDAAVVRYEIMYRQLALDAPEFAWWAGQQEHQATRRALATLETALRDLSTGPTPEDRRADVVRYHRAALTRPILSEGDAPGGVVIPTLQDSYIDPDYRIVTDLRNRSPASESLWESASVATNLAMYLAGHLTSPVATEAPLLVLGQPGAGKSVLTRILAARLSAGDFLPVRVELCEVPADADVQDQVEHAIRTATGRQVDWPDLAGSAGDALPVVLLDGFDELLQATGVSQTDYLVKVARFQEREAIQGRPVAVIVTSRTAVADRARTPPGSVLLRLEPFRIEQVDDWLRVWNDANEERWAARGLQALDPAVVRRLPDLSAQPLMLLMLALYDADSNALQRQVDHELDEAGLYEQLLRMFAAREIRKDPRSRSDAAVQAAVDAELLRLSVVAFAMFNRGRQWVTESELDADLTALHGEPPPRDGLRAGRRRGEIALGRFFFIQRSRAERDDRELFTYEFLHETFGEYLVARLVHRLVTDLAAQERAAATAAFGAGGCQDGLFHALLSFAPLAIRGPVLTFLQELAAGPSDLADLSELPVVLFRRLELRTDDTRYTTYQPAPLPGWSRHARYGLNLVLLAAVYRSGVHASDLFPRSAEVVEPWKTYARLWRAALAVEEWKALLSALRISHLWSTGSRDLLVATETDSERPLDPVDLYWIYDVAATTDEPTGPPRWRLDDTNIIAREVAFTGESTGGVTVHALEPLLPDLGGLALVLFGTPDRGWDRADRSDPLPRTVLHDLLRLTVARLTDRTLDDLTATYVNLSQVLLQWSVVLTPVAWQGARRAILSHLREDSRRIRTTDLTTIIGLLIQVSGDDPDRGLIVEAVVNHVAAVRPVLYEWAELRSLMRWGVGAHDSTFVQWAVGLWEAGIRPVEPIHGADLGWDAVERADPRLMARARAMYRVEFGRDLDDEIAAARGQNGGSAGAVPGPRQGDRAPRATPIDPSP